MSPTNSGDQSLNHKDKGMAVMMTAITRNPYAYIILPQFLLREMK